MYSTMVEEGNLTGYNSLKERNFNLEIDTKFVKI